MERDKGDFLFPKCLSLHKTEIKYRHKGGKWLPRGGRLIRLVVRRGGYIIDAETWQGVVDIDIDLLTRLVKAGSHEKAKAFLLEKVKATKRGNSIVYPQLIKARF